MLIRDAARADLDAIEAIYCHYVAGSTCTMQLEPGPASERLAWFEQHGPRHPVIVAEDAGEVVAWASLSRYHVRQGYAPTVEDSIYVRHDQRGAGLGRRLLAELIERAGRDGHHSIVAMVSADQPASLRLHEGFGFVRVAHLREVGFKMGQWIDVVFLQRLLTAAA
jgi:L-amino acid N-acyltransferase YncA